MIPSHTPQLPKFSAWQAAIVFLVLVRRFVVLIALMFWQGGFTFYASVVVPIGTKQLGAIDQGFITREVTSYINLSGAIALTILAGDVVLTRRQQRWSQVARAVSWLVMVVVLVVLAWLHTYLEQLLDASKQDSLQYLSFRLGHRWYLWLSTVQWGFGLLFAALTLFAWRHEDRTAAPSVLK
jgi:Na+-driven multidrug efflux pump